MAAELIGYIYSIDRRLSYVKKNGETLILNPGSHITSHTDAEIIAAPVPINITYTMGDTAFKCMYVPKSYLDKQTHVPASIFLKEASNVRDLIDSVQNNLDNTNIRLKNDEYALSEAKVDFTNKTTELTNDLASIKTDLDNINVTELTNDLASIKTDLDNINAHGGRSIAEVFESAIGCGNIYTWLRLRAQSANFAGLRIGDYIDVPITAGANVPAQTVRYRIGAIDHYYKCGDEVKGHHIVMVPSAPVRVTGDKASNKGYIQWRSENDNNGTANEKHPYLVSKLHDWEINDFLPALPIALQNAIMAQRVLLEERYSSSGKLTEASGWSWADLGKVWSPSEMEVYGCPVWGARGYSVGFDSQFPIFHDTASRTMASQLNWWLRSVDGGSSSNACGVNGYGYADSRELAYRWLRPLPCFLIG